MIKSSQSELAYHSTMTPPEIILTNGLTQGDKGLTISPIIEDFGNLVPKNKIFVSKDLLWDEGADYTYLVDISGMKKYPDFNTFADYNAYIEEDGLWWKEKDIKNLPNDLKNFVSENDGEIFYENISGEDSWRLVGTCIVEGPIPPEKIKLYKNNINKQSLNNSWYKISSEEISINDIKKIIPILKEKAQEIYDDWSQDENGYDEELGYGGICHLIAEEYAGILLSNFDIPVSTVSASIGTQHVYVIFAVDEGIYELDIHPSTYETGGGYNWKKIKNVQFSDLDISMSKIDPFPENFNQYAEGQ